MDCNLLLNNLQKIRYNRHNDLVIISEEFFSKLGENPSNELIDLLCIKLKCNRLAIKSKILSDGFRTPHVRLIRGDNSWVTHIDNGVQYTFDITKSMFSFGNIREKIRVSKLNCENEVIVDLFAGIGYFSIPFAVHSKAKLIHCCEWNPNAIIALNKNLELNRVSHKCVVHFGDNRLVCPTNVADRVYFGLIPTSLESLEVGCRSLNINSDKLILHVHENVSHYGFKTKEDINKIWFNWAKDLAEKVSQIMSSIHEKTEWFVEVLEINKVKAYAPHIDHLVVDLKCKQKI